MKKLLCLFLAICLIFSLTACGNNVQDNNQSSSSENFSSEETQTAQIKPLAAYNQAAKNMEEVMSNQKLSMTFDGTMKMSSDDIGISTEIGMNGDVKVSPKDNKMSVNMTMSAMGTDFTMSMYGDGTNMYMFMLGSTFKAPYDVDATEDFTESNLILFEDVTVLEDSREDLEDGSTKVSIKIDPDSLTETVKEALAEALESFDTGMDSEDAELSIEFDYKSLDIEATIDKDGIVKSCTLNCLADMKFEDQTVSYDLVLNYGFELLPDDYEISPPDNIDMENAVETEELPDGAI